MESQFKIFNLTCPKCGIAKGIKIPESLFLNKKFGTIKVQVPQNAVCQEHQFIAFITTKGAIVGYELIDASLSKEIPESKEIQQLGFTLNDLIDIYGFASVAGLIRAKLFDYPSFIIRNDESDVDIDKVNDILDNLIPDIYRNGNAIKNIQFDSYVFRNADFFYTMVRNNRPNAFLINNRRVILQKPWQLDMTLEEYLINRALERKEEEQLKVLSHLISQFLNEVHLAKSILDENKNISDKELMKQLKANFITSTINKERIAFIKEFIKRRF